MVHAQGMLLVQMHVLRVLQHALHLEIVDAAAHEHVRRAVDRPQPALLAIAAARRGQRPAGHSRLGATRPLRPIATELRFAQDQAAVLNAGDWILVAMTGGEKDGVRKDGLREALGKDRIVEKKQDASGISASNEVLFIKFSIFGKTTCSGKTALGWRHAKFTGVRAGGEGKEGKGNSEEVKNVKN